MNKKELKQLIKPIVKECINEVLLQEGVLSSIISEVVKGTAGIITETAQAPRQSQPKRRTQATPESAMRKLQERKANASVQKKKLLDAIGKDAYGGVDLFEGTQPLTKAGNPNAESSPQGALSGYAPDDAGVNIDGLLNIAGGAWKKIK